MPSFLSLSRLGAAALLFSSFVRAQEAPSTDPATYGADTETPFQTYVSAPDLKPPQLLISKNEGELADGYLFIGLDGEPDSTQNVPCIFGQIPNPLLTHYGNPTIDYPSLQTCLLVPDWEP